jgi:hypothetical protein
LNFRFNRTPDPEIGFASKAVIIRWPGLFVFGVTAIELLRVPAVSNDGDASVSTVGSNVTCIS